MIGIGGGIERFGCVMTTLGSLTGIEEDEGIVGLDCALTIWGTLVD